MTNQTILDQNIINFLGLEALADDKKIELINKISDLVQKRLSLKLVEQMTAEQKKEFDQLASTPDSAEQVVAFFQQTFPNFQELVKEEVVKIKQELNLAVHKK